VTLQFNQLSLLDQITPAVDNYNLAVEKKFLSNSVNTEELAPKISTTQILEWFGLFHHWDFIQAECTSGKPKWVTVSHHPVNSEKLFEKWSNPSQLVGVRFKGGKEGKTSYLMLDIDIGSQYHWRRNSPAIAKISEALSSIGLTYHLKIRSSDSDGLHLYFPFAQPVSCYRLAVAAKTCLQKAGLEIKPGQLEVFPNVKAPRSLYNAHRLPLQKGSYIIGCDFKATSNPCVPT
jgi:hypothetical protein